MFWFGRRYILEVCSILNVFGQIGRVRYITILGRYIELSIKQYEKLVYFFKLRLEWWKNPKVKIWISFQQECQLLKLT